MTDSTRSDDELYRSYSEHINPSYSVFLQRLGIESAAIKAEGAVITDSKGNQYIDFTAGYGIFNLGHNHPEIINALKQQLHSNQLLTRPLITQIQVEFAEKLSAALLDQLDCVFLCNSGSEAIDSAIKLARLATGKKNVISAVNSFHGFTFGALSATGIPKFQRFFAPLLPGFSFVPYGDIDSLECAIGQDTAAVLLEPVQHEAGVALPPEDYFQAVRNICDKHKILLILDEVKTGFGKTGELFAFFALNVEPDILVLGKSLGGGLIPSGAIVSSSKYWRKFGLSFPMSASSFAGNSLACCAGIKTLEILQQSDILTTGKSKGYKLKKQLLHLQQNFPDIITKVDGQGLLIGLEFKNSTLAHQVSRFSAQKGILIMPAFAKSSELMVEPPLVISTEHIEKLVESISQACKDISLNKG